jgi:VWFA-related protein
MTNKVRSALFLLILCPLYVFAQPPLIQEAEGKQRVRTVTIPISIFTRTELKTDRLEEFVQADRLMVHEDREEQSILSVRSVANTPLTLAVLIQDDLTSEVNLQLASIKDFIRRLPSGSRVMVAYIRGGSMDVRQRFTQDLERAASAIRIVVGSAAAPRSPYDTVTDALKRFDAQPAGRRAILMISDGLDTSQGSSGLAAINSIELDQAILRAQRNSVAVYSFYSPATATATGNSRLILQGQGALQKLAEQTGGRAFFQGSSAPISFDPFFSDLVILLNRQFALTYLSTHMKKGYHRVEVTSSNPEIRIQHPKGYYYR